MEISMNTSDWLELNDPTTKQRVWVNLALVRAIDKPGHTRLHFDKDNTLTVTEEPHEILARVGVVK
jgi:hypothetical protein